MEEQKKEELGREGQRFFWSFFKVFLLSLPSEKGGAWVMFKGSMDIVLAFCNRMWKSQLFGITVLIIAPMNQQPGQSGDKSQSKAYSDDEVKYRRKKKKVKTMEEALIQFW